MASNKVITTRKATYVTGYVTIAVIIAEYTPWVKDLPKELTVPVLSGLINAIKNTIKFKFGFDPFS